MEERVEEEELGAAVFGGGSKQVFFGFFFSVQDLPVTRRNSSDSPPETKGSD